MSAINEALRRAGREAAGGIETLPQAHGGGRKKPRRRLGSWWITALLILGIPIFAFLIIGRSPAPDNKKQDLVSKPAPAQTGSDQLPAKPVVRAEPALEMTSPPPEPASAPSPPALKPAPQPAVAPPPAAPPAPIPPEAASPEPVTALDHFRAARVAQEQGRDGEAIRLYQLAVREDPKLAEAYLNLGNIFFFRQRAPKKAIEMYKRVLTLDPNHKMAHNNLGVIFMQEGRSGQAETALAAALAQDPEYVDALYNMACVLTRQGREQEAMDYLKKAVRLQPEAALWAAEDQDLAALEGRPDFQELIREGAVQ